MGFLSRVKGGSLFFEPYYQTLNLTIPDRDTIWFCIGCGCEGTVALQINEEMRRDIDYGFGDLSFALSDPAAQERCNIAAAIDYIEEKLGPFTHHDCFEFWTNLSIATNHTSIVLWLLRNGYLKHHVIATPVSIWDWWQWWKPARARACLLELATMRRYFVTPEDENTIVRGVTIDAEAS